jgi:hypothetical protein
MSRQFDYGKNSYGQDNRVYGGQQARHYLGNDLLEHYGANPSNYKQFADQNYRMGTSSTNGRDTRLDNAIIGEVFNGTRFDGGNGYNAQDLTRPTGSNRGMSYQQQLNGIGARFDTAKTAYAETGEYKYFMMQKDLRDIAEEHLDADLRGFRLSSRK